MTSGHDLRRTDNLPPKFDRLLWVAACATAYTRCGRRDDHYQMLVDAVDTLNKDSEDGT